MSETTSNGSATAAAPIKRRTFLTLEIRGGDPALQKTCAEMVTLQLEFMVLFLQGVYCYRKAAAPEVILHPTVVEA